MEESTDLYAILGVLPSAEDVVIRAAFHILSQRYHPDRYKGSAAEGAARLKRIEEAYAILSDPSRRSQYDQEAGADACTDYADKGRSENLLDAPGWRSDWDLACRFYPTLRDTEAQFRAMSSALAFTFCATLLETKRFPEGEGIARQMEQAYLGKSFGDDPNILSFAKRLIVAGNHEAVRTLKQALKVLGSSTPASVIIETLTRDFLQAPEEPAGEPEPEPEPEPERTDAGAAQSVGKERAIEEPVAEEAPPEEPATEEPAAKDAGAEVAAQDKPTEPETAATSEEAPAVEEPVAEEPPAEEPAVEAEALADAAVSEPEAAAEMPKPVAAEAPTPEPVETVLDIAPAPPPPKPAALLTPTPKPAAKAAPAKHVFKDPKKRASAQSVIRACRAGEGLDLDLAATLVKAMDGAVNLKRADAQFGDLRVEVKFRGQSIIFSSGEFVEWVQRKILPEAKVSV